MAVPKPALRSRKMPDGFFQPGMASDLLYTRIRDAPLDDDDNYLGREHLNRARTFIEKIWLATSEYIDQDARLKARNELMPVFWEMYLAHALLENGITLVPRAKRRLVNNKGPDLVTASPTIAIEAVMPGNGFGPDGIARPQVGIAYDVPQEQMMLRIRSAIEDAAYRQADYKNGWTIARLPRHDPQEQQCAS